jgi:hypothetical protein
MSRFTSWSDLNFFVRTRHYFFNLMVCVKTLRFLLDAVLARFEIDSVGTCARV